MVAQLERAVFVHRFPRAVVVAADIGALGNLTARGEVEVFGHVRAYLAQWRARAHAGDAAPPTMDYRFSLVAGRLELPVLPDDAERVAALIRSLLARPGMTTARTRRGGRRSTTR